MFSRCRTKIKTPMNSASQNGADPHPNNAPAKIGDAAAATRAASDEKRNNAATAIQVAPAPIPTGHAAVISTPN